MQPIRGSVYDWQEFIPVACHNALVALGIQPGIMRGWQGHLKGAVFEFSFVGDAEQVKAVVQDFLHDEYGAENVRFYRKPTDSTKCYACFDWNRRKAHA